MNKTKTERWNLALNLEYQAAPWPWQDKGFADLTAQDVMALPGAMDGFLRYSPTDGPIDRVHVPGSLPREIPVCQTVLAMYHDVANIYVFISAETPVPGLRIPELVENLNEDFTVVMPAGCAGRGLYFGMNRKGESIGCTQIWDLDLPVDEMVGDLTQAGRDAVEGPGGSRASRLDGFYAARTLMTEKGVVGCFQIARSLLPLPSTVRVTEPGSFRLSVGRTCYATGECVSWGSPIIWSAREDQHGTVRLVETVRQALQPTLARLDLVYHPDTEAAELKADWQGVDPVAMSYLQKSSYAGYAEKVTFALNAQEVIVPLAESTQVEFKQVPPGWNRLEIMTASNPVREISFQKVSGKVVMPTGVAEATMPGIAELQDAFERWHVEHEKTYLGVGAWGEPPVKNRRHCLCHAGIFHVEPYLVASLVMKREAIYDQRIREACERMLGEQKPEGWYPCYCSANSREPQRGDGGAFTNGSVGEGMAMAAELLKEKTWLDSSERAADYSWYRAECNQNYAAFALWHLAELYQRDHQEKWLNQALYLARNLVTRDIGLSGAQAGHNYFTAYGNITLKGMARFLAVLSPTHEFYSELKDKVIRYTNQMLTRQQASGLFAGRNRKYLGYHHPVPGLFFVAQAIPEQAAQLAPVLAGMVRAIMKGGQEDTKRKVDSDSGLVLALAARYIKENK